MNLQSNDEPSRTAVVEEWLKEQQLPKHVKFAQNITVVDRLNQLKLEHNMRRSSSPDSQGRQSPVTSEQPPNSKFLPDIVQRRSKTTRFKDASTTDYYPQVLTTDATLYRTINEDALSVSSAQTQSTVDTRHPFDKQSERSYSPSVISSVRAPPSTAWSSSHNKERLSSLGFSESLPDTDLHRLEEIRQVIPDEFEKLVPTLIKLGVVLIPKKFLETNNEDLTGRELIDRHRVNLLLKQEDENQSRKAHLEELYGSVMRDEKVHRKKNLLRETLSFPGQLCLLACYQDEIERELNKKVKNWKTVSINNYRTNSSEYSYTTNRSSVLPNQNKKKHVHGSSSSRSDANYSLTGNNYLVKIVVPDTMNSEWKKLTLVNIIEQVMSLLDRVRTLSSISLPKISANELITAENSHNPKEIELIKSYKRWLYLCSTLYYEHYSIS